MLPYFLTSICGSHKMFIIIDKVELEFDTI